MRLRLSYRFKADKPLLSFRGFRARPIWQNLTIAATFFFASYLSAETRDWIPKLDTDKEKVEFLLQVMDEIPELIDVGTKYDMDLMHLLKQQNDLQKLQNSSLGFESITEHRRIK